MEGQQREECRCLPACRRCQGWSGARAAMAAPLARTPAPRTRCSQTKGGLTRWRRERASQPSNSPTHPPSFRARGGGPRRGARGVGGGGWPGPARPGSARPGPAGPSRGAGPEPGPGAERGAAQRRTSPGAGPGRCLSSVLGRGGEQALGFGAL